MSADESLNLTVMGLQQREKALASVLGILLVALRCGRVMDPELEAVLSSARVDAACLRGGRRTHLLKVISS